ncbi:Tetratricopeptide repeat protein 37 [Eufriesea mexicana]|nr:Tetratricopeptide repeat protein 37 [Eufriesea mexicana]
MFGPRVGPRSANQLPPKKGATSSTTKDRFWRKPFPRSEVVEYICRVYYEQDILDENFVDIDISQFFEYLLKLDKNSEVAVIAKAVYLRKSDNLITAREILKQMLTPKPHSVYGWLELSKISIRLNCWEDAEVAARRVLEINRGIKDELLYQMQLIALESISRSSDKHKWEIALHECEQYLKVRPSTQLHLIHTRISILLNQSDAYILLNNLESQHNIKMEASILRALYLKQNKQFDEAVNILHSVLETSEAWLLLGVIYWEMTEYNYSLMAFLNGVKADRYNWECLIYLGHYYREYGNDLERSRRCYQTALKINPNSEEAGIGLSTAYRLLKNQDANIQLLQVLTTQGSGPKWAWLQLGLQYLDRGNAEQAIKTLQHVVRLDPNDCRCWELLADAYFIRGAYTSALKTYQKALELCPGSLYPMIQLANIKLAIGQYDNAKEDFEHILADDSHYIPALKGLAEVCFALANYYTAKQLFGHANGYLQKAMDSLATAIKVRRDVSCVWKLLGNVYYKAATLPEKYSYLNISSIPVHHENIGNIALIKQRSMFALSIKCYRAAISLCPQLSSLWHDLALCYLMQLRYYPCSTDKSVANECLAAAKYAVKLCPSIWMHWNLLGVICMSPFIKNYALAQHSYIMAIDKDFNNSVVWSNLGTLYLHIGYLYKANAAYSRAQTADPAYINCWTGQSLIAEMMGKGEAMDLFRHATQLGYHSQAAIGYTHYLLKTILNSSAIYDSSVSHVMKKDYPLHDAFDVMTWYIEHHPNDCQARNAYGLLLERLKLYKSAAEQFVEAVSISGNDEKDLVRINLARVLIQIKKYKEAIKLSQTVTNANYNSNCHLALALFKVSLERVPKLLLYNLIKCRMTPLQMEIKFSYPKLAHNYEPDCIFGISSNLTVMAKVLLKLKILIPISMERSNEVSSSEDEFDLTLLNEEIVSIHNELDDTENNSSADDSDEVRSVRRRKVRVIDIDTTDDSQSDSSKWISCTESEEIPSRIPFIAGDTPAVIESRLQPPIPKTSV